jgi:ATP-dependent DNA helicase RecQ
MSALLWIKQAVTDWPYGLDSGAPEFADDGTDLPHERVWAALQVARDHPHLVGSRDLATLLRHSMRYEERFPGDFFFLVPSESIAPWPDVAIWKEHGFDVSKVGERYRLRAVTWSRPEWLFELHSQELSDPNHPLSAAESSAPRRSKPKPIPLDPALKGKFASIDSYWSKPQAEAIRGVMLSMRGSTHLLIYPTGSGKSLMGLAASMAERTQPAGITVVIVPTVALALDQVEQARRSFPEARINAWESGLDDATREEIKERIRNGSQTFLYTSPESLTGSLKPVLLEAAKNQLLQAFIVDEAHLISQWGSSFRPSFQTMTALWRELRDRCPFRTLLMTATVTEQTFLDLRHFFDRPESPLEVSAAPHLRAEIDSYAGKCESGEEKETRILQLLRHSPRPAILYVTKVEDAKNWHSLCRQHGWERAGLLHGESTVDERREAIRRWRANEIDMMVATSAFGLGMDKGDVRVVIHGCVPETIDRFYQEVGRGGRDGKATVALMVYDDEDFKLASKMSNPATISDELGLERWAAMFNAAIRVGDDQYDVDIDALRPSLKYRGVRNRQWNMQTLGLLVRSGVIGFEHLAPPELKQGENESDKAFEARKNAEWERYESTFRISLKRANPLNEADWEETISAYREAASARQFSSWRLLENVLRRSRTFSSALAEIYCVPEAGVEHVPGQPTDAVSCPPGHLQCRVSDSLAGMSKNHRFITYPSAGRTTGQLAIQLSEVLKLLCRNGIREISLPERWGMHAWDGVKNPLGEATNASREHFVIVRFLEEEDEHANTPAVPRVTLLTPEWTDISVPAHLYSLGRPIHLILIPEESLDPVHHDRRIGDARPDVIPINTVFDLLSS